MAVFLGLLLAVNNFSLERDFDETLKLFPVLKGPFKINLFVL